MGNTFQHHDAAQPAVKKVESVERHAKEVDEWVVPAGHEEEWNHVDHREIAGPVPHEGADHLERAREVDGSDAECHIRREVADEEKELHPRGQCADVEGRAELELAVVALAEDRRVHDVLLEPRVVLGRLGEVPLGVVVQACDGPDIPNEERGDPPDEQGGPDDAQDEEKIVRKHLVHDVRVGTRRRPLATTSAASCSLSRCSGCRCRRCRVRWASHDVLCVVPNPSLLVEKRVPVPLSDH